MENKQAQFAQEARDFITLHRHGILSTISLSQQGYPFGSIVPYDVDAGGNLIIYISLIAEHYKNLKADPRASLIVADPFGFKNPQAHSRATALVDFAVVAEEERERVQASYEARFPGSINYEIAHNFLFMRGTPKKIRWIGGFGDITWVDGERFRATTPDPLAYFGMEIIEHMNEDHEDALREFVAVHSAVNSKSCRVTMTGVSRKDFTIKTLDQGREQLVTVPFPHELADAEGVRGTLIRMLKEIRAKA